MGLDDEHAALQARCERLERELAQKDVRYAQHVDGWKVVGERAKSLAADNTRLRAALAPSEQNINTIAEFLQQLFDSQRYSTDSLRKKARDILELLRERALTEPPTEKGRSS